MAGKPRRRLTKLVANSGIRALRRAKRIIGSEVKLAAIVGVSQPSVHEMLARGAKVPAEWCIPVDIETTRLRDRVSCHQLRSDLYPLDFDPPTSTRESEPPSTTSMPAQASG